MTAALAISAALALPAEAITLTQVILAKKGSGKTYAAAVFCEELLKRRTTPVAIFDPTGASWGLKSSADGKAAGYPVVIFGGDHADIPLHPDQGEVIARAFIERRFSCVLDVSLLRKGEILRFMTGFLECLYRVNRESVHLVIDEADVIAPQRPMGEDARTLGAMQDIVRRGRIKGIGVTLITQRPQVLNKDVLTQADILWALRLNHPRDLGAIEEWIGVHADPKEARAMMDSLPSLPIGTAWIWAPAFDLLKRCQIRRRETFDSSRTPQPGEKLAKASVLASVDVAALGAELASAAEEVKQNDPKTLRTRIAELEKQLAAKPAIVPIDEAAIFQKGVMAERSEWQRMTDSILDAHIKPLEATMRQHIADICQELQLGPNEPPRPLTAGEQPPRPALVAPPQPTVPRKPPARLPAPPAGDNGALPRPSLLVLRELARWHPKRISKRKIAFSLGTNASTSTWRGWMAPLRSAGLIEEPGSDLALSAVGLELIADEIPPPPRTDAERLAHWRGVVGAKAADVLDLLHARGRWVSRDLIGSHFNVDTGSSTFRGWIAPLRTAELIVENNDRMAANPEAFSEVSL